MYKRFYCDPKINDVDDEVIGSKIPWLSFEFYCILVNGNVVWELTNTESQLNPNKTQKDAIKQTCV